MTLCKVCGEPAILDEIYCYPCYDEIAEMIAEYDSNTEFETDDTEDDE